MSYQFFFGIQRSFFNYSFRISSPIKYTSPMILPPPDVQAPTPPVGQGHQPHPECVRLSTFKPTPPPPSVVVDYQNQQNTNPRSRSASSTPPPPPLPPISGPGQQLCWTNQLYDSFNGSEVTAAAAAEGSFHDFARPPSIYKDLQPASAPLPSLPLHQGSGPNVNNKPSSTR